MILEVKGLRFAYNGRAVLDGIDFTLERGRIMAVVGINGAGKTTLLKNLNRILKPSRGVVLLEGLNLLELSGFQVARLLGYVPQRYDPGRLSVFESVLLGRRPHLSVAVGQSDLACVENALARLGIADLADCPVDQLSGGQAQKVILARALAQEPEILLLDEPTSSLDLKNQMEVMALVRRIVDGGKLAAVVSIHDLNLALRFADSFLFLKKGRVHALLDRQQVSAEVIGRVYGLKVVMAQVNGATVVVPA